MKACSISLAVLLLASSPAVNAAPAIQGSFAPYTLMGSGLTPFYVLGFELGPWQDYLAHELTPDFMLPSDAQPIAVSWIDTQAVTILPGFAEQLLGQPATRLQFRLDWQSHKDPVAMDGHLNGYPSGPWLGFERQLLAPGVLHAFDSGPQLGVSAVFAHQSFGVRDLGMRSYSTPVPALWNSRQYSPRQESAYGTGVRLALHHELTPGLALDAGYQSRIDMEEFAHYNGVYAQPADLDIPARASVGLALQTGQRSWLNVSIAHVMYSGVDAFPSRALPDRFLSKLGDSTSPVFNWEDLTVYSVGWSWSDSEDTQWRIDLTSRSQPLPSSAILARALEGSLADNAMLLGYSKKTGDRSRINLSAAYAPAEYAFGGNVLGVVSESLDQSLEFEAYWTLDF